jgi:3-hydroxyisobutyrate dehydrogenase-like beta-hydroxyacid dehydrogenase
MKKVAVIGVGIMGHGIADNFLKNGYEVLLWNRTADKAQDLVEKGAKLAANPGEAAKAADIVFEVTANDESVREIWSSKGGIFDNASKDQVLITCATISVEAIDVLAKEAESRGLKFFDMPMTGGRDGAEAGQLILLAGGDKAGIDAIRDDLKAVAKEVKYFGPVGSGMRYKLILNMLQAIHIAGFGEALKMAESAGLDKKLVAEALCERPGGIVTNIAWRDYQVEPDPINFSVEWLVKDLNYASKMTDIDHPYLDEVLKEYQAAIEQGHGQADWVKINKL